MTGDILIQKISHRIWQLEAFKQDTDLLRALAVMEKSLLRGNKVMVFGNGGSATQASHFAAELVNRFYIERQALAALALTTDMANLTAISNDYHYRSIFSRQLEALGKKEDVALGISTSGKSENVLLGLQKARDMGLKTVAMCGRYADDLQKLGIDVIISIPADDTPIIQEMHLFVLHMMAESLEQSAVAEKKA